MPCSPGMTGCHRRCLHRALVEGYRDARHAWEALRESSTVCDTAGAAGTTVAAYQLDDASFRAAHPAPTFKAWLIGHAKPQPENTVKPDLTADREDNVA